MLALAKSSLSFLSLSLSLPIYLSIYQSISLSLRTQLELELELELIQTHMIQKPLLWVEVAKSACVLVGIFELHQNLSPPARYDPQCPSLFDFFWVPGPRPMDLSVFDRSCTGCGTGHALSKSIPLSDQNDSYDRYSCPVLRSNSPPLPWALLQHGAASLLGSAMRQTR
jgi:hypothetical protein